MLEFPVPFSFCSGFPPTSPLDVCKTWTKPESCFPISPHPQIADVFCPICGGCIWLLPPAPYTSRLPGESCWKQPPLSSGVQVLILNHCHDAFCWNPLRFFYLAISYYLHQKKSIKNPIFICAREIDYSNISKIIFSGWLLVTLSRQQCHWTESCIEHYHNPQPWRAGTGCLPQQITHCRKGYMKACWSTVGHIHGDRP
jgi:hypothetical protein